MNWLERRLTHGTSPETFAFLAGQVSRWGSRYRRARQGRPAPRFEHAPQSGFFECVEPGLRHAFADRSRLRYYLKGLARRGGQLCSEYMLDHVDLREGDRVVEVGANYGDFSLALRQKGARVHLEAFEPAPVEFAVLQQNLAAHDHLLSHRAHQLALWNETTEGLTFYVKSSTADSSLLAPADYDETITIPTARLDAVLSRQPYRLLKLEAEGAEPEILEGAAGVIDCFDYVTADVGFERGVRGESTLPQVANFLILHGFEMIDFTRPRCVVLFRRRGPSGAMPPSPPSA